jgi:hypothetical protein
MGKANSLEVGEKDYWTAERSAARRSLFMMGNGLKRERNGLAALGRALAVRVPAGLGHRLGGEGGAAAQDAGHPGARIGDLGLGGQRGG